MSYFMSIIRKTLEKSVLVGLQISGISSLKIILCETNRDKNTYKMLFLNVI